MIKFGPSNRHKCDGFTLLELLLTVVLVLLLTSAMVFNFGNLARGSHLEEGTTRVETLMRYARAQAANSGRKVQLVFDGQSTNSPAATTGEVRATWEPDPLGQPGLFADLLEAQWHVQEINDLVQVESVKLLDVSGAAPLAPVGEEGQDELGTEATLARPMAPITFYPDGSSDSAEIILATRAAEDDHRMAVRLFGITGSISHRLLMADYDALGESGLPGALGETGEDSLPAALSSDEEMPSNLSSRPAASSSRDLPAAPPATVGATNSLDFLE